MLEFENTLIGYTKPLFTINSLVLNAGKVVALVAPNGTGKSTLLKTLSGEIVPISGEIRLNNKSLNTISIEKRAKEIAFVSSHFLGLEYCSVFDYVSLGRSPHTSIFGYLNDNDKQIVHESILKVGLSDVSEKLTTELSDGMRQLCMIARAIAQDTPIILLDEPTAFLDYSNKRKLMQVLKKAAKESNKLVLLSTHDIELSVSEQNPFLYYNKSTHQLIYEENCMLEALISNVFE